MIDNDVTWVDPEEMNLTTSTSDLDLHSAESTVQMDQEISFSLDIKIEPATTVCPNCDCANQLLPPPLLSIFTEEPVPCWHCGYPLK